jgi:hypothetical protein
MFLFDLNFTIFVLNIDDSFIEVEMQYFRANAIKKFFKTIKEYCNKYILKYTKYILKYNKNKYM